MPISPTFMMVTGTAKASSSLLGGPKMMPMINAIANAVTTYILTSATVSSSNVVVGPGSGVVTGTLVGLSSLQMSIGMMNRFTLYGMFGKDTKHLFDSISFGIVQGLQLAISQGTVIGGGPGSGVGTILNVLPMPLSKIILAFFATAGIVGEKSWQLADSISFGVCLHLSTTVKVMTTCIGVFTPPPIGPIPIPAAPGIGKLI